MRHKILEWHGRLAKITGWLSITYGAGKISRAEVLDRAAVLEEVAREMRETVEPRRTKE